MRRLEVGDPHVTAANLTESEALLQFVLDTAFLHKVDQIDLAGDLFDNHAVIRMEVLIFWLKWLDVLSTHFKTVVRVGNHDQLFHGSSMHALEVFKLFNRPNLVIVDKPLLQNDLAYMPYVHNNEEFVSEANKLYDLGGRTLLCHGEFEGSQYENGFYAPNGIKPELLKFNQIISGHVHKESKFGKVFHPGTARWLKSSDANQRKGLWIIKNDPDTGDILEETFVDTSNVCTPIYKLEWKQGQEMPQISQNGKITVELVGNSDWISEQVKLLKGKVSIQRTITDKLRPKKTIKTTSLEDFILTHSEINDKITRQQLYDFMKGLNLV